MTWAVMTKSTPSSIAARNGSRSKASISSRSALTTGISECESWLVLPWPGKCLAGGGQDALRPRPADERTNVSGGFVRIGAERARRDDRVAWITVDVRHRRTCDVDAACQRLAGLRTGG